MFTVLILAAFAAATISGIAGFGGALLLLPMLTVTVGPVHAVPLLTVAQFAGNFSRVGFGFREIRWRAASLFLATAIPCAVGGSLCFLTLPVAVVTRSIGFILVVFAFLRWRGWLQFTPSAWQLGVGGALVGFLSGLVGSAGPLSAAIFHSLGLPPVAYIATEAATALVLHAVKLATYQQFIGFNQPFWLLASVLSAAMIAGSWASRQLIERLPAEQFRVFVTFSIAAIGLYLLISGS